MEVPRQGSSLEYRGGLVSVITALPDGDDCHVIYKDALGSLGEARFTPEELVAATLAESDGLGRSDGTLAGLWAHWMRFVTPRLRAASLATRPLKPFAHQDEAVFLRMLPQPRLRFLLADEPGTGKTIMTGMYLLEGRRRGLIPGSTLIVVPAHLVTKWLEELDDFFGIPGDRLTPEVARSPHPLNPNVRAWVTSLELFTHNADVHRKAAGPRASWSLAVFDEAHRLTPSSRHYLSAKALADRSHHLLLLTATPHRGKEAFFRALCNLLDEKLFPMEGALGGEGVRTRPGQLSFIRRMKEDLFDHDGSRLFPSRYAHNTTVHLTKAECIAYEDVMGYAKQWYGDGGQLALTIYGKRAGSAFVAVRETLNRRLASLRGSALQRGSVQPPLGFDSDPAEGDRWSDAHDDPDGMELAEAAVVTARTRNKMEETAAVESLLERLDRVIAAGDPSKWIRAQEVLASHLIVPGNGQSLVFTEFADTARWLASRFKQEGYSVETLEGSVNQSVRHTLQQRFLAGGFQVLVSTDAGGEGINLQSAHVMINWDIPWSLVRLEQRMGRLHRIGQKRDVHVYHLISPQTREGRTQELLLQYIEDAAQALGGRIYDLMDATLARAGDGKFDLAKEFSRLQVDDGYRPKLPSREEISEAGRELAEEDKTLRDAGPDMNRAKRRAAEDRLQAINPAFVDGFVNAVASWNGWQVSSGPAPGIRRVEARLGVDLPNYLGGGRSAYVSADGRAIRAARDLGIGGLDDACILGPVEQAFVDMVHATRVGTERELHRGTVLLDDTSLTDYLLVAYDGVLSAEDDTGSVRLESPILVRWSGHGAFTVQWEVVLRLRANSNYAIESAPTPAQFTDTDRNAREALMTLATTLREERSDWVARARGQLDELRFQIERENEVIDDAHRRRARLAQFDKERDERLRQLARLEMVKASIPRRLGWAVVRAARPDRTAPHRGDAEAVAIARVLNELQRGGFGVDDRQSAGVGYDLLARHTRTGEIRLVEVKGFAEKLRPVMIEPHEWVQAQQHGDDYWLYVVNGCDTLPTVQLRVRNPWKHLHLGARGVERIQVAVAELRNAAEMQ